VDCTMTWARPLNRLRDHVGVVGLPTMSTRMPGFRPPSPRPLFTPTATTYVKSLSFTNSIVVCEIEHTQPRTYVVAKDGVHKLPPLPHGLLSILESAMKELGAPDIATTIRQLENPPEAILTHGRRFVRVVSRHLKPAVDHFELKTGQRIETFFFSHVPAKLEWLGVALGSAVELEVLIPNFEAWAPTAGLNIDAGSVTLNSSWLATLSLVYQLAPQPNE